MRTAVDLRIRRHDKGTLDVNLRAKAARPVEAHLGSNRFSADITSCLDRPLLYQLNLL